ncbi:hypothetical protein K439DRAFT_141269 [Ramaria rubella]|nr:hypothetical protein K439DRAFT_141269 [Ramaria rubella]
MVHHGLRTFEVPLTIRKPKQAVFSMSGAIVVQGSDDRCIYVHKFSSFKLIQKLAHASSGLVQTLTTHSYREQHWIASSCSTNSPTVKIWKPQHGRGFLRNWR